MKLALALVTAAVPTAQPALAQAPAPAAAPAPGARPAPPTPEQQEAALRQVGFSPTAIAAMKKNAVTDRAALQAAAPDIKAGGAALVAAAQATPFVEPRFEQLMRDQQARQDRLTALIAGNRAALLRSLPPADQALFAKLITGGLKAPGAPTAPPPPKK